MGRIAILLIAGVLTLQAERARADWISGVFSPRVEVDSIERFLVIRDWESDRDLGNTLFSLGDITSDGMTDLFVGVNTGSLLEIHPAFVFFGGLSPDSLPDIHLDSFKSSSNLVGDINADGYVDIGTYYPTEIRFHFGGPDIDDSVDFVIPNLFSFIRESADIDGDGNLDIALSTNVNGGPVHIYRIDHMRDTIPEYIINDTMLGFGTNVVAGDVNGDGWADLMVAASQNRIQNGLPNVVTFYWGGPTFDTVADFRIESMSPSFGRSILPFPDFNADGYDDVYIGGGADDPYGLYWGGPGFDGEVDLIINRGRFFNGYFPPTSLDVAGDFNHDGYPDLLAGYNEVVNFEFHIYFGGPISDTILDADIYITWDDIPGGNTDLGRRVAGIGDFNGDGVDDIAVKARTGSGVGWFADIYLFAGYDPTITDVPYSHDATVPDKFVLHQNYPNPFNPSTTIEFELPHQSHVTLEVFNILGQRVRMLLDRELPAGRIMIEWDGRDDGGRSVASGTYMYRLTAGEVVLSRKMVVVK